MSKHFSHTESMVIPKHQHAEWIFAHCQAVSARTLSRCLQHFGSLESCLQAGPGAWKPLHLSRAVQHALTHPHWNAIEKSHDWIKRHHGFVITLSDPNYPSLLATLPDPPPILFGLGNPQALSTLQCAIVGSRRATPYSLKQATLLATQLSDAHITITSGLALGIDGAAHRGALRSKHPVTIAVLGGGLARLYPERHRALAAQIVKQRGAIITEWPPFMPSLPHHFPRRNRIISGLSRGVLIVQATPQSGSLITARLALEQGRDVFTIPQAIGQYGAEGTNTLLKEGAIPITKADDILQEWQLPTHTPTLKANIESLLNHFPSDGTPIKIERLSQHTGQPIGALAPLLWQLERWGHLGRTPQGLFRAGIKNPTVDEP